MGGQFSRLGAKAVPYSATTSGLSTISGSVSKRSITRSALAWADCISARMRASCWMGSNSWVV